MRLNRNTLLAEWSNLIGFQLKHVSSKQSKKKYCCTPVNFKKFISVMSSDVGTG